MTSRTVDAGADPVGEILGQAQVLLDDLHLDSVKQWKAQGEKRLAVGILPIYAPRPLLEAMGCLPVALYGGGDQVDIIKGDSYFQSYICHIPRSVVELGLSGAYDSIDAFVFPSTCDVIRNLGGMWKLLFPQRYVAYLDLPQNFEPALGGRFYAHELRKVASALQDRGARWPEPPAFLRAIHQENRRRALLTRLDAVRAEQPWLVRASEVYLLSRAGGVMEAEAHCVMLEKFLAALPARKARRYDNVRVVVVGAFCEQPPMGLIRTLEKSGCDLVDDDFQMGLRMIEGPIPTTRAEADGLDVGPLNPEDPFDAMAIAFLARGAATATRYIGKNQKGRALVDKVKRLQADGVVFAAPSFCDPALLDQPMLEKALDDAHIPHTSFKYAENNGQFQTIREQAGAFSDSVKLFGDAA